MDTLVVKDLSRFGRNYLQVGYYTEIVFPKKGVRFIAINNNVDTIQNADQIILLNQGRIEEMGTHAELLAKKGHYYEMVQEQEKAKKWIVKGA